mmetsp:Transcript_17204/g.29307  ORF Transcript_17204/g.29307 Transcript_17204/m.29307 type:complete len:325 (-) Transcript_17204:382-1356(-)
MSWNLVESMYPRILAESFLTSSWCFVCGLEMRHACVSMSVELIVRPAARMVVPVSTRSTTASAKPRPIAASTDPETNLMSVFVSSPSMAAALASSGAKNLRAMLGKEVTMREPWYAPTGLSACSRGTCSASLHLPNPSSCSMLTGTSVSATMSWPVMPMSTLPSPTYCAMSAAGRKTSVMGRLVHSATSTRSGRWYSRPAASRNLTHLSCMRPFLGTPNRRRDDVLDAFVEMAFCIVGEQSRSGRAWEMALAVSEPGRRARAAAAWPARPSRSPRCAASSTMPCAIGRSSTRIQVRTRRKVITESPPIERAVPPVGSVWLGPAP